METLKFTLEIKGHSFVDHVIFPFLIFLLFTLGFPVYEIYFEGADVETLEVYEVLKQFISFGIFFYFMYPYFYNQFKLGKVKRKWGKLNSNLIAIPKMELKEIEELESTIKIQINNFSFKIDEKAFENLDQFKVIPDKSGDKSAILWLLKWVILGFLFIYAMILFVHARDNPNIG